MDSPHATYEMYKNYRKDAGAAFVVVACGPCAATLNNYNWNAATLRAKKWRWSDFMGARMAEVFCR